ncbi:adhesion G-protein coupled receptor G2-like [Acanthaster planci]|uniref:Adhesion G-protein coupled receptor G2-like n=1 Tax=Acanthaster planci TaxID=133434 RepID=A0A8B7ZG41_ACAPL|nr:adhesion G-protein coupled receptor G2-like [Acanthaster planci]
MYKFSDGYLTFLKTRVTETQHSLEECVTKTGGNQPVALRLCDGNAQTSAFWRDPIIRDCKVNSDVNKQLDHLSDYPVTKDNVNGIAKAFLDLTDDPSSLDSEGIESSADVLDSIIGVGDTSSTTTEQVVLAVNNLLQVPASAFGAPTNSSSRLVQSLEKQVSYALSRGGNFSSVAGSLGVEAFNLPLATLSGGLLFATIYNESGSGALTEDSIVTLTGGDGVRDENIETKIYLPGAIVDLLPSPPENDHLPVSFGIYQKSTLFQSKSVREGKTKQRVVGSRIVTAAFHGVRVENLPLNSSVVSTFRLTTNVAEGRRIAEETRECVFWDFTLNHGIGDWSNAGCQTVSTDSLGLTTCSCNHLTSFAVLVDIYGQKKSSPALDIISKIGCGVSIIGLLVTLGIYLSIESLRVKIPSRILICLCFSLLCLYLIFLVGIEQTSSGHGCLVVAVLLHYFTLASLAWMAVEATNLYLYLVKVFNIQRRHFVLKASAVAWGVPLLIVIIILSVDYTQYQNTSFCYLKTGNAFYYGQLLVLGIVVVYNTAIFILVMANMYRPGKLRGSAHMRQRLMTRAQNAIAICNLVGLTWVFGILTVFESSSFAFQVLFSVFNSLQGLFIFLLFCVRQETTRVVLARCVRRRARAALKISFSSLKKYNSGTRYPSQDKLIQLPNRSLTMSTSPDDDQEHPFCVPVMDSGFGMASGTNLHR